MEEPGKLLKNLDLPLWEDIPIPVLIADIKNSEITSANPAALKMFKLKPELVGVTWPGVLSMINVSPSAGTARLKLDKLADKAKKSKNPELKRTINFRFQDSINFEDKVFEIIISIPKSHKKALIIVDDKSALTQSIESRTDFVTLASHQLRTPISSAMWNLDFFIKKYHKSLSGKQNHVIDNVSRSLNSINKLIEALMNVSKIETGKLEITPEPTRLEDLLNDIKDEITPALESRDVSFEVNIESKLPQVEVDGSLTRYLFLNLIYNAIKYSDRGGRITLDLSRKDHIILNRLEDEGMGIAESSQHKVFRKFYRSPNAVKRDPNGSGLGLYLCKMIVERFGGSIWFESEVGNGTTFWFTLPIRRFSRR